MLDLSFNLLRSVPDRLEHLTSLDTVYFVQNKISKITGLSYSVMLRSLELGGNRIRVRGTLGLALMLSLTCRQKIEGLDALVNLEELWLGKNKITKLEGLGNLKKLKILSLQSNRITKLENLEELKELDQLYLSHNGIERLEGLDHNVSMIPVTFFLVLLLAFRLTFPSEDQIDYFGCGQQLHPCDRKYRPPDKPTGTLGMTG